MKVKIFNNQKINQNLENIGEDNMATTTKITVIIISEKKEYLVKISSEKTVGDLKKKIQKLSGIPENRQTLLASGYGFMANDVTLEEYDIEDGDVIKLIARKK